MTNDDDIHDLRFNGKVAIVTGAASGIGRATALAFAREGARLALADINESGLSETVGLIGEATVLAQRLDVTSSNDVRSFVAAVVERYGRLDCAANVAGIITPPTQLADFSEADFDRTIAVNLKGVWLCMKEEISAMLRSGGGTIVNVASDAGILATPSAGAYVASKHGVVGLTKAAALDYAKAGIRVNAICPGYTRTPMALGCVEDRDSGDLSAAIAMHPIGRIGEAGEQADAILYLASGRSSFILGQCLPVDGGYSVW